MRAPWTALLTPLFSINVMVNVPQQQYLLAWRTHQRLLCLRLGGKAVLVRALVVTAPATDMDLIYVPAAAPRKWDEIGPLVEVGRGDFASSAVNTGVPSHVIPSALSIRCLRCPGSDSNYRFR